MLILTVLATACANASGNGALGSTTTAPSLPPKPAPSTAFALSRYRWNPELPISYAIVSQHLDPSVVSQYRADVQNVVAQAERATGLSFSFAGTFPSMNSTNQLKQVSVCAQWNPQMIAFTWGTTGANPATFHVCANPDSDQTVSAVVTVSSRLPPGTSSEGPDLLFCLAGSLGLDPIDQPGEVMSKTPTVPYSTYQLGDLNGLWRVGPAGTKSRGISVGS